MLNLKGQNDVDDARHQGEGQIDGRMTLACRAQMFAFYSALK